MLAKPQDLGYDPTMTVVLPRANGTPHYDIDVRSEAGEEQTYRTQELLAGGHLSYIVGRGKIGRAHV